MSARTAAPPIAPTVVTATWRRDLLVALAGLWPVGGLYLDGWAHTHVPQLETFFTPWHAVLYSGFLVLAFSLVPTAWWRQRAPVRAAVPAGYALGLIGAVIFALGGVADTIWHTLLGIEIDLEALLSPPHLVLMTAGILMIGTPLRSAAARRGSLSQPAPLSRAGAYLPAIISAFSVTAVAAFFLEYVSPFVDAHVAAVDPGWQAPGVAQYLIITVVLVVPVLYAWARLGRVPPGMIIAVTLAAAVPVGIFNDFQVLAGQLWVLPGALIAEVIVRLVAARLVPLVAGLAIPGLIWPLHILGVATTIGLTWSVELWAGTIVLCTLAGASLGGLLVQPTADTPR
jgi:hypothetical protein